MAVRFPSTVPFMVGKGSIPQEYRQHAVKLAQKRIRALLDERDPDGKAAWTEKSIGKRWGLSQATINELKNGGGAKMGLRILIAIRGALQISLDDLLGLPPLTINKAAPKDSLPADVRAAVKRRHNVVTLAGEADSAGLGGEDENPRRPR